MIGVFLGKFFASRLFRPLAIGAGAVTALGALALFISAFNDRGHLIDELEKDNATHERINEGQDNARACSGGWIERLRCHRGE